MPPILRTERADVLLTYDAQGGYGHRDHVRVHEVGCPGRRDRRAPRASSRPPSPATRSPEPCDWVGRVYRYPAEFDPTAFERSFTARADITHRINVRRQAGAKRASMRAHASQASNNGRAATGRWPRSCGSPGPLYDVVFGREWFRDPSAKASGGTVGADGIRTDIFEGLP